MTDTTPADELRTAAEKLRETAIAAGGSGWIADHYSEGTIVRPSGSEVSLFVLAADGARAVGTPCVTPPIGAHIALMHPGVGLALADWLDKEAAFWQSAVTSDAHGHRPTGAALAVARQVLGPAR